MSIATLKKKSYARYGGLSTQVPQFSTTGTHRNQGWVGQTSLSRTLVRSLRNGPTLRGHGGCCGYYPQNHSIIGPELCSKNDNKVVKKASMNTKGMLMSKYRWIRRPSPYTSVKPGSGFILYRSQGARIERKHKEVVCSACMTNMPKDCNRCNTAPKLFRNYLNTPQSFSEPYVGTTTKSEDLIGVAKSHEQYVKQASGCCVEVDKEFLDQDNQQSTCGSTNTCG